MWMIADQTKIGIFLLINAGFFAFLGVMFLMDGGLFSVSNLCLIPGIFLIFGVRRLMAWIVQPRKLPGTAAFVVGVYMVARGYTYLGFIVEFFGFLNLFGNFYPTAFAFLKGTLMWGFSFTGLGAADS